jgi:putative transposase
MSSEGKAVSIAQLCRWFGVSRSTFYYRPPTTAPRVPALDPALVATIRTIIEAEPAAGLRMITARVRRASPVPINRKKVHRILKINGWQVRQRPRGQRPRVAGWTSRTTEPNVRWAIDTTHLFCGGDGWCHCTSSKSSGPFGLVSKRHSRRVEVVMRRTDSPASAGAASRV